MTTLADIRTRLRKDLHDTDAAAYRWTDAQLDRHIEHALSDLNLTIPRQQSATLATTPGSRDLSLLSLSGLIEVEAVEFPTGAYPPVYAPFGRWGDTLRLGMDTLPAGQDARVFYTAKHTVDGSGSTLPAHLEDVLAVGAAGYAATELASYSIDRLNVAPDVEEAQAAWGRARLTAFRQLLRHHGRDGRVRGRRL